MELSIFLRSDSKLQIIRDKYEVLGWTFVRVNGVNQHSLSLRLATEDNLQGLLRSLSLSKEIEKIKCVCFVWGGEQ